MKNSTRIVGWTKKKAFDGVIDGKHITSPEKVVLHLVQRINNPDYHGETVDTLKLPVEQAIAINNGSEEFNNLIGCNVRLDYQLINNRPQLVDITIFNADGTEFVKDAKK